MDKHYSAEHSVFFANSQGFNGEACSIFAGPYTVTHHKSTLLIAGMFSFMNAGSGSNQSNHMYNTSKSYWVQVEGEPDESMLAQLRDGVRLKDGITRPAVVTRIDPPSALWPRNPPVRFRKTVADSWLDITISEGRNRQVRRMTAAIGAPTLRLIRHRVGSWALGDLASGAWRTG